MIDTKSSYTYFRPSALRVPGMADVRRFGLIMGYEFRRETYFRCLHDAHEEAWSLEKRGFWQHASQLVEQVFRNFEEIADGEFADRVRADKAEYYIMMLKYDQARTTVNLGSSSGKACRLPCIRREEARGLHHGSAVLLHDIPGHLAHELNGQVGIVRGKWDWAPNCNLFRVVVGADVYTVKRKQMTLVQRQVIQISLTANSKDSWTVTCVRMSGEVCATFTVLRPLLKDMRSIVAREVGVPEGGAQLLLNGWIVIHDGPAGLDALLCHADALADVTANPDTPLAADGGPKSSPEAPRPHPRASPMTGLCVEFRGKKRLIDLTTGEPVRKAAVKRRQDSAPVSLCIFPYGTNAASHVETWPAGQCVFQVQVVHDAHPSVVDDIVPAMDAFLAQACTSVADPKSLQDLSAKCGFLLHVTPRTSGVPASMVPYCVGFYIAGSAVHLSALVNLLLCYVEFRFNGGFTGDWKEPFPHVHDQRVDIFRSVGVPLHVALRDCVRGVLVNEQCGLNGAPVQSLFEMRVPLGRERDDGWLVLEVEVDDETHVSMGWSGRTWGLRQAFEDANVCLREDGIGGLIRVASGWRGKVETDEDQAFILKLITDDLFSFPCLVCAEDVPEDDGKDYKAVTAFLQKLRALPFVLFVKDTSWPQRLDQAPARLVPDLQPPFRDDNRGDL